jgi:hypothetical protein
MGRVRIPHHKLAQEITDFPQVPQMLRAIYSLLTLDRFLPTRSKD